MFGSMVAQGQRGITFTNYSKSSAESVSAARCWIVRIIFVQSRCIAEDCTERALGPDLKIAQQQRHQRHENEGEAVRGHHEHRQCAQYQEIYIPPHPLLQLLVGHRIIARLERLPKMSGR